MKKKKTHITLLDYGSVVLSFLIFMLAWFNGNLTDMPWYGLLLTIALTTAAALTIFSVLDLHGHRRIAIGFSIMLLLLSIPSTMHHSSGSLSVPETILFYLKQVYIPVLAATSLFLLLKKKQSIWKALLRWGSRVYAVLGILLGTIILHTEITRNIVPEAANIAESNSEVATILVVVTVIGIILTVVGLIINPLYVVWRNTKEDKGKSE